MRLKEIPNYLNKKVRRKKWLPSNYYIYFDGVFWKDFSGLYPQMESPAYAEDEIDWEVYDEPNKDKACAFLCKRKDGFYFISYTSQEIAKDIINKNLERRPEWDVLI